MVLFPAPAFPSRTSFMIKANENYTKDFRLTRLGAGIRMEKRSVLTLIQCHEIQIVFVFVNSRIPAAPSSRPKPERFTPPNGKRGSEATIPVMKNISVSRADLK